jgi:hypothetical protein
MTKNKNSSALGAPLYFNDGEVNMALLNLLQKVLKDGTATK